MSVDGTTLLVSGPLPAICLKCAGVDGVTAHRHRFAVVGDPGSLGEVADAAALVSDAAGGLLGVAGFVRTLKSTREAEVDVPLCGPCSAAWRRARWVHHGVVAAGAVAVVVGVVGLALGPRLEGTRLYVVVGAFTAAALVAMRGLPHLVATRVLSPRALTARRIDERGVVLGGVSERWRATVDGVARLRVGS